MQNLNIPPGLLNFCLKHGWDPEASVNKNRDPRDYEWLREALGNLESEVDKMKKIVDQIKELQQEHELQNEKTNILLVLLEELQYFVEDLDNANELHKIGGLEPILNLLSQSDNSKVKMWCAWIITSLLQNNPKGQQLAKELNIYETLTKELSLQQDEETRVKLLSALSAYFGQNPQEVRRLILQPKTTFWDLLRESLLQKTNKEKIRALVLCQNLLLLLTKPIQDAFREADLIVSLWKELVLAEPESEYCSKLLNVLVLLLQGSEENVKALGAQDRVILVNKATKLKKDEENYSTEIDNLKSLLNLVQK